jgi:L-lysine exporter family protein LysE/ArgO
VIVEHVPASSSAVHLFDNAHRPGDVRAVLLGFLWKGILLGLGAAAPIGPVNVEIARRSLRGGFRAGCALGLGAVTIDVLYAVLASVGVRLLLDRAWLLNTLTVLGAALLGYLAVQCFRSARRQILDRQRGFPLDAAVSAVATPPPSTHGAPPGRNYVTGLLMTGLNPMTLVFWFVVVPGVVGQISANPSRELPLICAGVFLGALSWVLFFSSIMSAAGKVGRQKVLFCADLAGGMLLLAFAGVAIWRVCTSLL